MRKAPHNQLDDSCDQVGTTNCYQQNQRKKTRLHRYSMASCQIKEQEMSYLCYGGSWKDQLRSREMYTLRFIDYSKALDNVKHESLVDFLQSLDVDKPETRLLTNLYWKQTAAVRSGDDISEWLDIKQGLTQGCVVSPHLFALYTDMIMRELDDMDGFRIGSTVVNNLRYADDTMIISESEEQLQRLINVMVTKSEEKGLYLNRANSFAMVFSKASQISTCNINVDGKILEQVHSFVYDSSHPSAEMLCLVNTAIWM